MNIFEIEYIWVFFLLLWIIAFMYASVGHGGGSGYLALMALFSFPPEAMKPTALLLNLFVAAISFAHYARARHFNMKLFLPFAIASIPLAFLGGMMEVNPSVYKKVLAGFLIFAVLKILNFFGKEKQEELKVIKHWQGVGVGGSIGFLSGLIGIGGGIVLSPVILLMRWGRMKETAAVSALFIWVNSAAAMTGQLSRGVRISPQAFILVGVAVTGGFLGGYFGSNKLNNNVLRYMLAFVLIIACIKLFIT